MNLCSEESELNSAELDRLIKEQLIILRNRLFLLDGKDKIIMSMYIESGISYRQIALVLGVSPSSVLRKVKRFTHELTKGTFTLCLQKPDLFTENEILIARDYFLRGLSIKQIARTRKSSFYNIREIIKEIQKNACNP